MKKKYAATNNQEDEDGYLPEFTNTIPSKILKPGETLRNGKTPARKKLPPATWQLNSPPVAPSDQIK
jgi:hypothetical protein